MSQPSHFDPRIMIVDDHPTNVALLRQLLAREGYQHIIGLTDARPVPDLIAAAPPDLILLDLIMPHYDGYAVLERLAKLLPATDFLPVIVLTADSAPQAKRRALALGAKDFLTKPFDAVEVLLRVRNILETRRLYLELQEANAHLEARVEERTQALTTAQSEIVLRLGWAAEYRDDAMGEHARRVAATSERLAHALGLNGEEIRLIKEAATLHDLGKIAIPDAILLKPGRLTEPEAVQMRTHTTIGATLLAGGHFPLIQTAQTIARSHHERWDGRGYPDGLGGEAIPLSARIVAVADALDGMIQQRPYKPAWPLERALATIRDERGAQFDPQIVDALLTLITIQ